MKITIPALVAAAFAVPALAQDAATDYSTVTCADFMAMDEAGMQTAFEGMGAAMPSGEAANADATASGADAGTATAATDAGAATPDASGATAPGDTTAQMTALRDACTADPSMMAMDAMTQAMGGAGAAGTEAATGAESSGG